MRYDNLAGVDSSYASFRDELGDTPGDWQAKRLDLMKLGQSLAKKLLNR